MEQRNTAGGPRRICRAFLGAEVPKTQTLMSDLDFQADEGFLQGGQRWSHLVK